MTTYYVSLAGSDSNNGTSAATPWLTIAKVNATAFVAGDVINFNGGDTFTSTSKLYLQYSGASGNPITYQSYGTGKATINVTADNCIYCYNASYVTVKNLNFTGVSTADGLSYYNGSAVNLSGIVIDGVDVSGAQNGLAMGGSGKGYTGAQVLNSSFHNNRDGVLFYGPAFTGANWIHLNTEVTDCSFYSNPGLATMTTDSSGYGMAMGSTNGATILRCKAYNNGASNGFASAGPVGIMVYDSNAVTIDSCVAYGNMSGGNPGDGDGLDLDLNTSNSTIQNCISYNNVGAGILLYNNTSSYWTGNTVRWNVCWGNATANTYGEIYFDGTLSSSSVYNNTCVSRNANPPVAVYGSGTKTGINLYNNVFYAGSTSKAAHSATAFATTAVWFRGNHYYSTGTFGIQWGANNRTSLASWQTSDSQEKNGATLYGVQGDPRLRNAAVSPSVTDPLNLGPAQVMSPTARFSTSAGLDLNSLFSINPGTRDFFGRNVASSRLPTGAIVPLPAENNHNTTVIRASL